MGVTEGINKFKGVQKKKQFEKEFQEWVLQKRSRHAYIDLLHNFDTAYNDLEKYRLAIIYLTEAGLSTELIYFASAFTELAETTKETSQEDLDAIISSLKEETETFFKDYHQPIDREVAVAMLTAYRENQPEDFRPSILNLIDKKYDGSVERYVNDLFDKSMFTSKDKVMKMLDNYKVSKAKKITKDPAVMAYEDFMDFYRTKIMPESSRHSKK